MRLAARGACNLDRGEEKISDDAAAAQVRRDAFRIHAWALAAAAILVLAAFLLSGAF